MTGVGKPKLHIKTPYNLEKLTLLLDLQTQYFLFDVQHLWSYDYNKRAIFTKKNAFYNGKFLISEGCTTQVYKQFSEQ